MIDVLSKSLRLPCGATLSNRLAKASMTEGLADPMNRATERHVRLYGRWARGGAGLLLSGNVQVDRTHLERPGNIAVDGNGGLDALRAMAKAGTCAGNHLWMQINHPGRQTPANINPTPLAPSAVPLATVEVGCGEPVAMTEAQITDLIRRFIHVADVARETGFTGVQVHAAHGYLNSQFLSPLSNVRTDAWGGSLENRARFLMEIVRGTRKAVGRDFPLSVKLNSSDFQKCGFSDEDSMQVVRWLAEASVDLIEISGGNYEQPQMIGRGDAQLAAAEPVNKPIAQSTRLREAYFLDYAARIRPTTAVPLMITGGFRSRTAMVSALQADQLDVVGLARPLCADPEICAKLLSGEANETPAPERSIVLDRASIGAEVSDTVFKIMASYAPVGWCYVQLFRLGDGEDPIFNLSPLQSLSLYEAKDQEVLLALQRPWMSMSNSAGSTGQ
jgi:2,4-dienoyl-CoA reductase-like NADH-dependent reductase (Old Yellow Enzyme family)